MRSLIQPGPTHPIRIDCHQGTARELRFTLHPGTSLNEAVTAPLIQAGFQSAVVTIRDAPLNPFHYVMPGPPDDASHVAYFTAPVTPAGTSRIEQANATFGWAAGKPSIHCHAVWAEPDGQRRGGHILPHETIIAGPAEATAWGFTDLRLEAAADPETNFTLFQPSGISRPGTALLARIKPNQDLVTAVESIAAAHGFRNADIRGSLGSLIGAEFADGSRVPDTATEVLIRQGSVRDGQAELDLLVVDRHGQLHQGRARRGANPVCITFDIVLIAAA